MPRRSRKTKYPAYSGPSKTAAEVAASICALYRTSHGASKSQEGKSGPPLSIPEFAQLIQDLIHLRDSPLAGLPGVPSPATLESATKLARVVQKNAGSALMSATFESADSAKEPFLPNPFLKRGQHSDSSQLFVGLKAKHKVLGTVHSISSITGSGGGGNIDVQPSLPVEHGGGGLCVCLGNAFWSHFDPVADATSSGASAGTTSSSSTSPATDDDSTVDVLKFVQEWGTCIMDPSLIDAGLFGISAVQNSVTLAKLEQYVAERAGAAQGLADAAPAASSTLKSPNASNALVDAVQTGPFKGVRRKDAQEQLNKVFLRDCKTFREQDPDADLTSVMLEYLKVMAEISGDG